MKRPVGSPTTKGQQDGYPLLEKVHRSFRSSGTCERREQQHPVQLSQGTVVFMCTMTRAFDVIAYEDVHHDGKSQGGLGREL